MAKYWDKVVAIAIARESIGLKPFTKTQIERSAEWQTCACGKQDSRIPRKKDEGSGSKSWCPVDDRLRWAGINFYEALVNQNPKDAKKYLDQIEKRAGFVIQKAILTQAKDKAYRDYMSLLGQLDDLKEDLTLS